MTQDERTMAMLAHLLGIVTGFLGPLVIWLIKKDQSKFVAYHALAGADLPDRPQS